MTGIDEELTALVLELAEPAVAAAVVRRLGADYVPLTRPTADTAPAAGGTGAAAARIVTGPVPGPRMAGGRETASPEDLARCDDLGDAEIQRLLAMDAPGVDAVLFANPRLSDEERRRMLSGVGPDGRPTPVHQRLVDLLWTAETRLLRRWLPLAVGSGDPAVAEVVLGRRVLHTEAGRLRLVAAVWEGHGPEAARTVLDGAGFPAGTVAAIEAALDAPSGLVDLRRRLAVEESGPRIAADLLALTDKHEWYVEQLVDEGTVLPWEELLRLHRESPLPYDAHRALAARPDCPRVLLLDLLRAGLPDLDDETPWLERALALGTVSPHDLFTYAGPAHRVLALLLSGDFASRRVWWEPSASRAEPGGLFRARLGTDEETWAVVLRLLPDFVGTVPELLETAVAAVAVPSG